MVLYGSRARGDHRPDSDYDIAVFLRGAAVDWDERERMAEFGLDLLIAKGWDVSIKLFKLSEWRIQTFFMHNLRREGIEI